MEQHNCPECGVAYNSTLNRLVKEACGHDKCRQCLLAADAGCPQCDGNIIEEAPSSSGTADYESGPVNEVVVGEEEEEMADNMYWDEEQEDEEAANPNYEVIEHSTEQGDCVEERVEEVGDMAGVYMIGYPKVEVGAEEEQQADEFDEKHVTNSPPPAKIATKRARQSRPAKVIRDRQAKATVDDETIEDPILRGARISKKFYRNNMPGHLRKYPGDTNKYECRICQKLLARHTLNYHIYCDPKIPKPFTCDQCGKEFRTPDHFRYHVASHSQFALECSHCDKSFKNKSTLSAHVRQTHSGIPAPHVCATCNKSFFSAAKYQLHQNMHNEVLSFTCSLCPRMFRLKENMVKHINITHTDEKPFSCDVCKMQFKRLGSYKKHMARTHSIGGQPVLASCKECGKGFTHMTMLRRHELEHGDQLLEYHCELCTVSCTRRDNMLRHIRMMHFDGVLAKMGNPMEHMRVMERKRGEREEDEGEENEKEGEKGAMIGQEELIVDEYSATGAECEVEEGQVEEELDDDDEQTDRKSSVIIYVGAKARGAAGKGARTRGGSAATRRRGGSRVGQRGGGVAKQEVEDFSTMSSDKMEIYRKILMPSPDYQAMEGNRRGGGEVAQPRKRRTRVT